MGYTVEEVAMKRWMIVLLLVGVTLLLVYVVFGRARYTFVNAGAGVLYRIDNLTGEVYEIQDGEATYVDAPTAAVVVKQKFTKRDAPQPEPEQPATTETTMETYSSDYSVSEPMTSEMLYVFHSEERQGPTCFLYAVSRLLDCLG